MATTSASPLVIAQTRGLVKWIRFNRPEVKNAITPDSADQMRAEIESSVSEGARVIVLTGAGGSFCSGADLKAIAPRMDQEVKVRDILVNHYHPLILAMTQSPLPVIAAVDGAAAGIGCDIALAADMRLVSDKALFAAIFVNINLIPDGGGTFTLSRLVGSGRALEMAMTGCRVPADKALEWGMANHVYPSDRFEESVQQFAEELAKKAPMSMARSKAAIRQNLGEGSLERALDHEAATQQELIESQDFREGVTAFLQKRPPDFQGR